jgi:hypothetical protein
MFEAHETRHAIVLEQAGDGMMPNKTRLLATLAATTILVSGAAFAATTPPADSPAQMNADKDFSKLSSDGSRAYQDLVLTRLAIYDGRPDDAKKFVNEADQDFTKARSDTTVFKKAEADLKAPGDSASDKAADAGKPAASPDMKTVKAWLPVDGDVGLDEDFAATPAKAAAVADANKSVAKGDHKGAIEKLKLADVNLEVVLAIVPLDQTITDVHQAADLVNSGKYYEASQLLHKVQDSTRYDVADVSGVPKSTAAMPSGTSPSANGMAKEPAKTH